MDLCLHPDFTTYMYDRKVGTSRILSIGSRNTAIASRWGRGVGFTPYHLLRVLLPLGLIEEA